MLDGVQQFTGAGITLEGLKLHILQGVPENAGYFRPGIARKGLRLAGRKRTIRRHTAKKRIGLAAEQESDSTRMVPRGELEGMNGKRAGGGGVC